MGAGSRKRAESCAVEQEGAAEEGGKLRGGAGRGGGRGRKVARWSRERRCKRAESCAVEQEGAAEEGSGGANNACNFWGRVVREKSCFIRFCLL